MTRRAPRTPGSRSRQRGFTLIELMIALVISSLLVGMILAIFARMSLAYRGQQQVANLQQVLAAARNVVENDAKQAGLQMSQGFKLIDGDGAAGVLRSPIVITNSSTGPDQVAFFYADGGTQAAVRVASTWPASVTVDDQTGFALGDLVVMTTPDTNTLQNPLGPTTDARLATFDTCILKIASVGGNVMTFDAAAPWGIAGNTHCSIPAADTTMIYKFIARAYRIDPDTARVADGVLQVSPTGNLQASTTDWQDLAFGFTDIQVATYFFDNDAVDSPTDPDTDPKRDWINDGGQATYTAPVLKSGAFIPPLQMSISLVARTDRDVEGISTIATPNLNGPTLGDRAAVSLGTTTDPALVGNRIVRYSTFLVDLRNMGVGR